MSWVPERAGVVDPEQAGRGRAGGRGSGGERDMLLAALLGLRCALLPVDPSMRSFGVAIKGAACDCPDATPQGEDEPCSEQVIFEHSLGSGATHGSIRQMWHAGELPSGVGDPRMRVYVDEEVGTPHAAVGECDRLQATFSPAPAFSHQ